MYRYYHKVINPQMGSLQKHLETDTNYELIRVIPYTAYETVLVFIEHTEDDPLNAPTTEPSDKHADQ